MKLRDREPVAVRYFSFYTSFNVTGDWLYDCRQTDSPDEMYPERQR